MAPFVGHTFGAVLSQFSILDHFDTFGKGIINLQDVSYYVFLSVFFLFMTLRALDSAHWRS
jgi:hypothetical protein